MIRAYAGPSRRPWAEGKGGVSRQSGAAPRWGKDRRQLPTTRLLPPFIFRSARQLEAFCTKQGTEVPPKKKKKSEVQEAFEARQAAARTRFGETMAPIKSAMRTECR